MVRSYEKWSGLGNDFILLRELPPNWDPQRLCDGSEGLVADGVLLVTPPGDEPASMVIYNRDGSRPEMCGNGLRCAVRYLMEGGFDLSAGIRSDAGLHEVGPLKGDEVTVTVGSARWLDPMMGQPQSIGDLQFYAVDVGNPHAIFFDPVDDVDLVDLGQRMQRDDRYPAGSNVHLVTEVEAVFHVRHFERGVGLTEACGTGAAAVAWSAVQIGRGRWPVTTQLPGGQLRFSLAEGGGLWMTGPAQRIGSGVLH